MCGSRSWSVRKESTTIMKLRICDYTFTRQVVCSSECLNLNNTYERVKFKLKNKFLKSKAVFIEWNRKSSEIIIIL